MPSPRSTNIKLTLLVVATLIVLGTLYYSQILVSQLLQKERDVAALYARSVEFIANKPAEGLSGQSDYSFIFDEVIRSIDFPMVLTDPRHQPIRPYEKSARNIPIDSGLTPEQMEKYFISIIKELDEIHTPIRVTLQDTIVLNYVHYGESPLITRLRWLPAVELGVAGLFILMGYVGFSYIKRNEQSNIWVGMAKETAHQLGTPLSSLMGWIEMMKTTAKDHPEQLSVLAEMENDLDRLQKITDRFSKIGSRPSLKEENLEEVIRAVLGYFQQRLPSRFAKNRKIGLKVAAEGDPKARINRELFEWVIENLVKNALEAIEESEGTISFTITGSGSHVTIDATDTGKGIDIKHRKDIFRPGFSTKRRGWGLGLSLSKRIVETYHHGKLFVRESKPGKGTTFRIRLNR
ncbi:MAG TPA: HAMP domain-containing sensor histidine kinase [Bacteroidota bacterium]|nr:HAMP domain-containing sensor histidine kinase [Bacteroidota bacterium]